MKNTKLRRPFEEFSALDLYDDELKSIKIAPLPTENHSTIVKLEWIDDGSGHTKWLTFHGCRNLASASPDTEKVKKFVNGQRPHWRTGYMPPLPKDSPVRSKLASLGSFTLFKINFQVGTIEVLAKRFTLRNQK